jgi:hypothetical protein
MATLPHNPNQTLAQTTESLSLNTLKESAAILKSQAFSKEALSEAFLYKQALALYQDERLSKVSFNQYKSIQELIFHVCYEGDALQKIALCEAFDFKIMLALPRIDTLEHKAEVVATIKAQLLDLAGYFACAVQGDINTLAWIMAKTYGNLTIFDFVKFFAMCKTRAFTGEYEFVKTQGINPDFILKWLDLYCDTRDAEIDSLRDELRREDAPTYDPSVLELHRNILKQTIALEAEAKRLRREYETSVLTKEGNEMFYDEKGNPLGLYKVRIPVEKAHIIRLFNFVRDFVTFQDDTTPKVLVKIGERIGQDFDAADAESQYYFQAKGITKDVFKRQQALALIKKYERIIKELNPVHVLEKSFMSVFKNYNSTKDFITFLGLSVTPTNGMTEEETLRSFTLNMIAKKIVQNFQKQYLNYLTECVAQEVVPLENKFYVVHRVLHFLCTKGLDRPFQDMAEIN